MSYNIRTTLDVQDNLNIGLNASISGSLSVTGSNGRLIYRGTTPGIYPTLAEVHINNDYPWLHRFYNDTFSTSSAVMAYFGWNDGRFVFHNESTQSIGLQVNGYSAENGLLVYSDKVAFVNNVEVTGSLNALSITGSLQGTASFATQAISSSFASTASFAPNYLLTSNTRSFATTGSNIFIGNQTITGSLLLTASNATYALDITGTGRMSNLTLGNGTLMAIYPVSDGFNFANNGSQIRLQGNLLSTAGYGVNIINSNGNKTWTTGNGGDLQVWGNYTPTSGNGTHNGIIITNTISQSGAANGITRGLYINPTLTSAVDYRAIESTSGSIIFNHGSNVLFYASSSGNVAIGTTSSLGRLQVRGDGTNATIRGEDSTGVVKFSVASSTGTPELLLHSNGGFNLNSKFQSLSQNAIDITNQGLTLSNINNTNQGVIGISGYTFAPAAGSGSFRPINLAYTINASGPQVGSVTGILVNATETSLSGSTHNLIDLQISGSSRFKVNNTSTIITGSLLITGSSITIGSTTISSTTTSTFVGGVGSDIYTTYGSQNKPITLRFKTGTTPSTLTQGVVIENALSSYIVTNQVGSFGMLDLTAVAYQPTAGGADFYGINLSNTINSQGSGSIKAIYYNPTITRITGSHRFIESTAGDVLIQSGSYPLLFVTGSGRVGIGTATPAYDLDILTPSGDTNYLRVAGNGVSNTNGNITLGNVTGTAGVFAPLLSSKSSNLSYPGMYFIGDGASGTDSGTTPMIRFDGRINNGTVATRPLIGFANAGTDLVTILANGRVGIGTTSPSAMLHVRGATSGSGTTAFRVENSSASASLTVTDFGTVTTGGPLVIGNTAAFPVNGSATIQSTFGNHVGQFEIRPNNLSSLIYFSNGGSGGGLYLGTSKFFSTPLSVFASGSVIVGDYSGFANNTAAPARFAVSGSGAQTLVKVDSTTISNILNISSSGAVTISGSLNLNGQTVISTGSVTLTTGSITMPNRSAFRVFGASVTGIPASTTISGSATTVDYNQGNNYNNATGVYTAPVAGLYSVYYNGRTNSGATQQVIIYRNSITSSLMWETTGSNSGHFGVSSILNLAVNDTLRATVTAGTIQFDNNDNWGAAFIG